MKNFKFVALGIIVGSTFSLSSWGLNLQEILAQSAKNNVKKKEAPPENKPAQPTPPVAQPTPPAAQPQAPVAQPTPPPSQPTPPVAQPNPPAAEAKAPTAQNKPAPTPAPQSKPQGEQNKPAPTPTPVAQPTAPTVPSAPATPPHHQKPHQGQVLSGLSNDAISITIQRHRSETQGCVQAARMHSPNLNGQIFVNFNIQPNGVVSDISTRTNTTGNSMVERCLKNHLQTWIFPKPEAPVVTTVVAWPILDTMGLNGSGTAEAYPPQVVTPEEQYTPPAVNILGKTFHREHYGRHHNRGHIKLHAVQIFQPRGFNPYNGYRQLTGVRVSIQGNRPGYLFLSSKEPAYWIITGKTHLVQGIHLHGMNRSKVSGIDPSLVSRDFMQPYEDYIPERSPATSDEPGEALMTFVDQTGLPLGSVQGDWEGSSFTVYMGH